MRRSFIPAAFLAAALLFFAIGCGPRIDCDLPESPNEFHTGSFANPADSDDTYQSIEYNGRTYIGFGTIKTPIDGNDVGRCLGYIVQDGAVMKDMRIFLLDADPDANFLVQIFTDGFMNQPIFFRALDTKEKEIGVPPYIESLDYLYWK